MRIPTGAGFVVAAATVYAISSGQVSEGSQVWPLTAITVAAMVCDVLIAFARRPLRR
ncbi:hypothetical protein AB0I82_04565 [Streptomyces sp. NPDC050315]|uniref:hypothetical protein n=1 Tax=Streptomyces sp. NPDC050315 TaxID=3155039 RepID=UPI0034393E1B